VNGNNGAAPASRPLSDIVVEFGKHTLAGIALFLIIAAAAVALDLFVRYLSVLKVSAWLIIGLQVIGDLTVRG
jgi:hypothetical protein